MRMKLMLLPLIAMVIGMAAVSAAISTSAIILTSDNEADLAVANALADKMGAKVVVTPWGTLSDEAIDEIETSGATMVYVIGGEVAVPDVEEKIKIKVKRFAGKDRYETAALVAKEWKECHRVVIAVGHDFIGINQALQEAKKNKCPIILIKPDEIPKEAEEVLEELNANESIIVECPNLNNTVKAQIKAHIVEEIKSNWEERAKEAIDKANETIIKAKNISGTITNATTAAASKLIINAEYHLSKAVEAFEEENYGKAFGLAIAAKENAENAIRIIQGIKGGTLGKEVHKWEEKINTSGVDEIVQQLSEEAENYGIKLEIKKKVKKVEYRQVKSEMG